MTSKVTMPIVFARVVLENLNHNIHRADYGLSWSDILKESLRGIEFTKNELVDKCSAERWPAGWFETEDEISDELDIEECQVAEGMRDEVSDYLTGLEEQGILEVNCYGNKVGPYRFSRQWVNMVEDLDILKEYFSEMCNEEESLIYNKMSSYYLQDAYSVRERKTEKETKATETKSNKDRALA